MKRGGVGNLWLSGQYRSGLEPHCDGVNGASDRYCGIMMTVMGGVRWEPHFELESLTDSMAVSALYTSCGSNGRLRLQIVISGWGILKLIGLQVCSLFVEI